MRRAVRACVRGTRCESECDADMPRRSELLCALFTLVAPAPLCAAILGHPALEHLYVHLSALPVARSVYSFSLFDQQSSLWSHMFAETVNHLALTQPKTTLPLYERVWASSIKT